MMMIRSLIQGTFGAVQGTFGMIQGTFGVIPMTMMIISRLANTYGRKVIEHSARFGVVAMTFSGILC
jgi:hypothetical protein